MTSRVLLISMPFANVRWPNLGLSLLKAALEQRGVRCDIAYFNFDFAEKTGLEDYDWVGDSFAFVLGGERLFAKHYFPGGLPDDERYYREVLKPADSALSEADVADFERIGVHVAPFLNDCMAAIDWSQYALVGFTVSFQQTMASLCLARRIKEAWPETTITFGGAACEGEMGLELLRQFREIDYVFLGEADLTFPPVVEQLLAGKPVQMTPGVAGRETLAAPLPPACCELPFLHDPQAFMVQRMDDLPYPDFDDYFGRLGSSPLATHIDPLLFFETSRGCWWGQKHHCAFCGLNGATLAYRSKKPRRALDELSYLAERYDVHRACAADNILDYRYFESFLPLLARSGPQLAFVYEMKTNVTRSKVDLLLDAGLGAAQLGIESFSTPVLKQVGKGANAMQNLQALKWFSEAGIEVKWNILYGFPEEDPDDYAQFAALVPSLVHLAPPSAIGRVRLDRFSPYFRNPAAHGIVNPRPNRAFRHVYPFDDATLSRIAYYFEFDYTDPRNPLDYAAPLVAAVEQWRQTYPSAQLTCHDGPDGELILHDTRPCATSFQRRLTGWEREVYLHCDTGRSLDQLLRFVADHHASFSVVESVVRRTVEQWVAARILVSLDEKHLSLAFRVS